MSSLSQLDHDLFRILLYRGNCEELLLEHTDKGFALPTTLIPRHTRIAQQITEIIRNDWKLQTSCLFPIGDPHSPAYAVELCGAGHRHPASMNWLPVHTLTERNFREARDFHALQIAARLGDQYHNGEITGAFARPGWLRDVTEWVESKAAPLGLHPTGEFQQFNASPTFSLIRFETNGSALWFKAVGEPNLREYPITIELAKFFSSFVPRVIALRENWNAWLAIETEGTHPDEKSDSETWTRVARTLGELQIASLGQTLHLLNAGCRDVRARTLLGLVEPFLEGMADLMERQTKQSPPALSRSEIATLRTQLQNTLSEATDSEIPNAIGHLDFNPGNIVVNSCACTFLDWAEACAGPPFLTFQYLLEHLRRYHPANSWQSAVTSAYLHTWRSVISQEQITEALRLSPLLAVFAYAACADAWRDPEARKRPETARYFRSLTRRMKREADRLIDLQSVTGVPCLG
jgi:Ser/Thr protein kinase RdoA (MazF antagonist)